MDTSRSTARSVVFALLACVALSACGGTKMLKEPVPIGAVGPIASAQHDDVVATLDWVIVRDGPGTWARNADWDEYVLTLANTSDQAIDITVVTVVDSLGTRLEPQFDRTRLVRNSKRTARRYRDEGIRVKAGNSAGTMLVAGAAVTAAGVVGYQAAAVSMIMGSSAGSGLAAAGGLVILGPTLAVGGFVRAVNNGRVNSQIEIRQSQLPLSLPAGETVQAHVFFPLAPSPRQLEVAYSVGAVEHVAVLDTSAALDGLHLDQQQ